MADTVGTSAGALWWLVVFLAEPPPPLRGIEAYAYSTRELCGQILEVVEETTASKAQEGTSPSAGLPERLAMVALSRGPEEVMACVDDGTLRKLRAGKEPHKIATYMDPASAMLPIERVKPEWSPQDALRRGWPDE